MAGLKPIRHDQELSLIDHLDELRSRLILSLVVLVVAFAVCFWQSDFVLDLAADPLPLANRDLLVLAPAEAFMTTITVCLYGALVLAAPFISYQIFAYVLPAFSPRERRTILPIVLAIPLLFFAGVVFSYFIILPAAIDFLLNFNASQFNTELRARDYYGFFGITMLAGGVVFQLPVIILGMVRLGIVTVDQLRRNRKYAVLIIAVIAAALPGVDPITMLIEMVPLLVLYELSIVIARVFGSGRGSEVLEPEIQEN